MNWGNVLVLVAYFLAVWAIAFFLPRAKDKESFLAGNRNISWPRMALSIAATWIWAPALFVSGEKAYVDGLVGLLWFLVPNVLCLILFIPFAKRLRQRLPRGYTLSEYMERVYSQRVKRIYLVELVGLAFLSTIVQLVAGGKVIHTMTGIPFWATTVILGLFILAYSLRSGIVSSVTTDFWQFLFIFGGLVVIVPMLAGEVGARSIVEGLGGVKNNGDIGFFDAHGIEVMLAFGIPTVIGLLSGPFGDQNFWQRALSVREQDVGKAFFGGAIAFATVPLLMSTIGFMAYGSGFQSSDPSMVNLEMIQDYLPYWATVVFMFILISGLASTVDSNLSSISALVHDMKQGASMKDFRLGMVVMTIAAIICSNIPATIVDFFLFYGALRSTTLVVTILTLMDVRLSERGAFYGVLASMLIGFPTFVYGKMIGNTTVSLAGNILILVLAGAVALTLTRWRRHA
ncbi:sodium:solute symporter family protein [Geobacillus thermodenitrificans subsp. calidus]